MLIRIVERVALNIHDCIAFGEPIVRLYVTRIKPCHSPPIINRSTMAVYYKPCLLTCVLIGCRQHHDAIISFHCASVLHFISFLVATVRVSCIHSHGNALVAVVRSSSVEYIPVVIKSACYGYVLHRDFRIP